MRDREVPKSPCFPFLILLLVFLLCVFTEPFKSSFLLCVLIYYTKPETETLNVCGAIRKCADICKNGKQTLDVQTPCSTSSLLFCFFLRIVCNTKPGEMKPSKKHST